MLVVVVVEEEGHVIVVGYWEDVELEKVVAVVQQEVEVLKRKGVEVRMMGAVAVGLTVPMRAFESQEVEEVSCQ
ncbi:hypothetical protein EYC84_010077 [Monilinia fructicola]|uniref:Uncharacterized protein n=1 Tax=Monilinia fructicola TaxID=38448 RepID=A0A5M9JIQ1_MONFR|nr:hypothetical protein EYC84_010077 [Monilinia fructicola]